MIRRILLLALLAIVCVALALTFASRVERKVVVLEFEWSVDRSTAPYTFGIQNRTDEALDVIVTIVAETISQRKDGVKLIPLGRRVDEIHLTPHETRTVEGVVPLIRMGTSETVLTLSAELKEPQGKR